MLIVVFHVQERYLEYNAHAASYTWKALQEEVRTVVRLSAPWR